MHVLDECQPSESSALVRERVGAARVYQKERGAINAQLPANILIEVTACDEATAALLKSASDRFALSARVQHKVLRVARTIADLAGEPSVGEGHMAEAIGLRGNGGGSK